MPKVSKKEKKNSILKVGKSMPSTALFLGRTIKKNESFPLQVLNLSRFIKEEDIGTDVEDETSTNNPQMPQSLTAPDNSCLNVTIKKEFSKNREDISKTNVEDKEDISNLINKKFQEHNYPEFYISSKGNNAEFHKLGSDLVATAGIGSTKRAQVKTLNYSADTVSPDSFKLSDNKELNSFKNVSPISEKSKEVSKILTLHFNFDLETITGCLKILNPYLSKSHQPSYLNIIPKTCVSEKRKMNSYDSLPHAKKNKSSVTFFESKNSMPQLDFISSNDFHIENDFVNNTKNNENTKIRNAPKVVSFPNTSNTNVSSISVSQIQELIASIKDTLTASNIKPLFSGESHSVVSNECASQEDKVEHMTEKGNLKNPTSSRNLNSKATTVPIANISEKLRKKVAIEKLQMTPRNQADLFQLNASDDNNYDQNTSKNSSGAATCSGGELRTSSTTYRLLKNCVIEWKASWLNLPCSETPPILDQVIKNVKNSYESYEDYVSTYLGLHLLSLWFNIKRSANSNTKTFSCKFYSTRQKNDNYQKNVFRMIAEKKDMPPQQRIVLISYSKNGIQLSLFGYVKKIEVRKLKASDKNNVFDALLTVYSAEKIELPLNSHLSIKMLCAIRVASKQYEALILGASIMKTVVCQPDRNIHRFRTVHWSDIFSLEPYIGTIIQHVMSPEIYVTVICKPCVENDSMLVIQRLIVHILLSNFNILICLSDEEKLFKIAREIKLAKSFTMIAIKEKEVNIPEDLQDHSLRGNAAKLHRKETEVIENSKIMLTTLTHIFLGEAKKLPANTVCLIVDAHLICEAETALAMEMSPQSLLLYGAKEERRELDLPLQERNYNKTLFHRLLECGNP